ncbi:MAG: DUF1848 domain-containing protein [Defluviitaleaceae bacterium]|nr:DUF1848 domain-containing protein [Defluviitaleaceae bacterium]
MIISASRRTDIPAYYADWFCNRIKAGYVLVRNPMNFRQVSRITLSAEEIDAIVFWTKNPQPLIERLGELSQYMYYFQFTLTPYGRDIEPNLPQKPQVLQTFKRLAEEIGPERVLWRYDPILLNEKYSQEYHIHAFGKIAEELRNHTKKVTISFIDANYRGVKSNIKTLALQDFPQENKLKLSAQLAKIAHENKLEISACAEEMDLQPLGITRARCIDDRLLSKLLNQQMPTNKDKNQRQECGCITAADIGAYNTCRTNCRYCYANYNSSAIDGNINNPESPLLIGDINEDDKISERRKR